MTRSDAILCHMTPSDVMCCQVNNAGCMVNQRELTDDGLEKNFATNTLGNLLAVYMSMCECFVTPGTYLLTTGLIPALENSSDPRVVSFIHIFPFPVPSFVVFPGHSLVWRHVSHKTRPTRLTI